MAVTQYTGYFNRFSEQAFDRRLAIDGVTRKRPGHHRTGNREEGEHIVVPIQLMDVEQQGSGSIRIICGMDSTAGEFPDQPAVHVAHQQLSPVCCGAGTCDIVENPLDAASGEIRVDNQTGSFFHKRFLAGSLECVADILATHALPHDSVTDRFAGQTVPDNHGFTLIGQCQGAVGGGAAAFLHHFPDNGDRVAVEDFRVVLNPTFPGIDLLVRAGCGTDQRAILLEKKGFRALGALVDGNDAGHVVLF